MTEQVAAAQYVFEEAKEDFDRPAVVIQQRNDLGWNVHQVCCDAEKAVAVLARRTRADSAF